MEYKKTYKPVKFVIPQKKAGEAEGNGSGNNNDENRQVETVTATSESVGPPAGTVTATIESVNPPQFETTISLGASGLQTPGSNLSSEDIPKKGDIAFASIDNITPPPPVDDSVPFGKYTGIQMQLSDIDLPPPPSPIHADHVTIGTVIPPSPVAGTVFTIGHVDSQEPERESVTVISTWPPPAKPLETVEDKPASASEVKAVTVGLVRPVSPGSVKVTTLGHVKSQGRSDLKPLDDKGDGGLVRSQSPAAQRYGNTLPPALRVHRSVSPNVGRKLAQFGSEKPQAHEGSGTTSVTVELDRSRSPVRKYQFNDGDSKRSESPVPVNKAMDFGDIRSASQITAFLENIKTLQGAVTSLQQGRTEPSQSTLTSGKNVWQPGSGNTAPAQVHVRPASPVTHEDVGPSGESIVLVGSDWKPVGESVVIRAHSPAPDDARSSPPGPDNIRSHSPAPRSEVRSLSPAPLKMTTQTTTTMPAQNAAQITFQAKGPEKQGFTFGNDGSRPPVQPVYKAMNFGEIRSQSPTPTVTIQAGIVRPQSPVPVNKGMDFGNFRSASPATATINVDNVNQQPASQKEGVTIGYVNPPIQQREEVVAPVYVQASAPQREGVPTGYVQAPAPQREGVVIEFVQAPASRREGVSPGYVQPPAHETFTEENTRPSLKRDGVVTGYVQAQAPHREGVSTGYVQAPAPHREGVSTGYVQAPAPQRAGVSTGYVQAPAHETLTEENTRPSLKREGVATGYVQAPTPQREGVTTGYVLAPTPQREGVTTGYVQAPMPQKGVTTGYVQAPGAQQREGVVIEYVQASAPQREGVSTGYVQAPAHETLTEENTRPSLTIQKARKPDQYSSTVSQESVPPQSVSSHTNIVPATQATVSVGTVETPAVHVSVLHGSSQPPANASAAPSATMVTTGMANIRIGDGPGSQQVGYEDFPPPPPELLQQQYLYGAAPQQGVFTQMAAPQGKGVTTFRPGAGATEVPVPQQAGISNIPVTSTPINVEKRNMGQEPPTAPASFKLIPVKTEKESAPPPAPAPGPHQKPTLDALDRQVLHTVDDHAIQVSKSDHKSVRELVWDLIYSKNITNEIEKCRVVFRWLATKNLKEVNFNHVDKGSPEEVLMGLKTGKTTYAMVFDTMCSYAGLHSKIISGFAKGADYRPGQKFAPGSNQHSWNAVYIYGTWCLIDAHWAARRIIGKQATSDEFHYQLDEYFFLTDSAQLIFTHFPDDQKWQLLERSVTLEEFENMPHMKPQFFKFGLEFVSHRTAVVYGRGEINIRLRYPAHRLVVAFNFSVQFENGDEDYRGAKLNKYGMQESVAGVASFRLRLPQKGNYILYVYAKEDTPENKENVYAQVCEYKIVQEDVACPEPEPFPPCAYLNWGPGAAFYRYGLATYQQTATILTRDGKAELQFRIPKPMQFMAKLKQNNRSDAELEGYCMNRIVGNTAYFNITAPSRGEYGLEIYANDPSVEGTTLYHVAQYMIECHEDVKAVPLPKLPAGYLGAQPKFNEFGLNTLSHHDPVIHTERNQLEIQFSTAQEMRVTANLIDVENEKDYPDFVFTQTQGCSLISFEVTLPATGFYKLQLYAISANDASQQLPGVYNYLINCTKLSVRAYAFPKQYAQWKEGCYMEKPLILHKDLSQSQVPFHVLVPKAAAVAVVAGDDWTHLVNNQPGMWEGQVNLDKHWGKNTKVTLNANYGGDPTSYATLLEYCV